MKMKRTNGSVSPAQMDTTEYPPEGQNEECEVHCGSEVSTTREVCDGCGLTLEYFPENDRFQHVYGNMDVDPMPCPKESNFCWPCGKYHHKGHPHLLDFKPQPPI